MNGAWIWWIAAAVLIGAELLTDTFYLLAIGVAMGIGGVVAWLGGGLAWQFAVAGALGVALTIAAHRWRLAQVPPPADAPLDIGKPVHVRTWNADGTARVDYRGSQWNAEVESPAVSRSAQLYICATRGSVLVLSDRRPGD